MIEYTVQVYNNRTIWLNKEGQLHREDGPAVEHSDGSKEWFLNDKHHREDGPAVEYANGDKEWYINDKELTEDEFNNRHKIEMTVAEIEAQLGHPVKIVK